MTAKYQHLSIRQGETFTRIVRWETNPIMYVPITAIAQAAPALITAPNHGLTNGWRVAVIDVLGMVEINSQNFPPTDADMLPATVVNSNNISLNDISAASFDPYLSGGYVMFYTPVDLTGYTARMTIKDRIGGTVLIALTMAAAPASGLAIDSGNNLITITIDAADTTAFTWQTGVYDLELVSVAGIVTTILRGDVEVSDEVTT